MQLLRSRAARLLVIVLLFAVGACRTTPPPEPKPEPTNQSSPEAKSAPQAKATPERPLLSGKIINVSMYPVPNRPADLVVSLVVDVGNTGLPAKAQGWKLEINSPSRKDTAFLDPVHVNGVVEMPGSKNTKVDLDKEDLAIKSAQSPIDKGTRLRGILTFVITKTAEKDLSNNNSNFTIHFKDPQGNSYQTPRSVIGRKASAP